MRVDLTAEQGAEVLAWMHRARFHGGVFVRTAVTERVHYTVPVEGGERWCKVEEVTEHTVVIDVSPDAHPCQVLESRPRGDIADVQIDDGMWKYDTDYYGFQAKARELGLA